jgi:polysaccharide export outer membrane protein
VLPASLALALAWLAVGTTATAAPPAHEPIEPARTTAEIRILLPDDSRPLVAVAPGTDRIALELPAGAEYPKNFAASTGGLLRGGSAVGIGGDRVRLDLDLASGYLDEVIYEPEAVVLRFRSRFEPPADLADPDEQYLIGPDDQVKVTVYNHPELTSEVRVTRDGLLTAPLVGEVRAGGLTTRQLAAKLAELLGRDFLVNPQVEAQVVEYRSQWVILSGEVQRQGRIALRGGTRLKEALAEAGGFSEFAGEEITVTRRKTTGDGSAVRTIRRADFESGAENPLLADGDLVEVARAARCYIQGEVRHPGEIRIERGMTLLRVIAIAEGLTEWANRKEVRILYGDGTERSERTYNVNKILEGKAPDPVMEGGEVIVVPRRFL